MGQRLIRVNELVSRALNEILHTIYRDFATYMTVGEVSISPDLRDAYIYYSVVGGPDKEKEVFKFLTKKKEEIRIHLFKRVILKYSPRLNFRLDVSCARGVRITGLLDDLENEIR